MRKTSPEGGSSTPGRVCGVVLCGGKSRRFGSDKGRVVWEGESLASRAFHLVEQVAPEMVLASGQPGKVYVPGKRHIQDKWEDSGPLAGIEAAFSATEADVLLVLALDLPFVTRENLDLLIWSWEAPLTVARDEVGGRVQPLCGLWSRALHGPLIAYLESGRRSVMGFIEGYPYKEVDLSPESLINVNESSDLPRRNA